MHHEIAVYPTSRCGLRCNQCIMQHFMDEHLGYDMSLQELESLLLAAEQSRYHLHYILTGGEPLLWKHLQPAVLRIRQSPSCDSLVLFTNAIDVSRLDEDTVALLDQVRISQYDDPRNLQNSLLLAAQFPAKVRIVPREEFWTNPDKPLGLHKPVACLNERQYLFMKDRVYACPHNASIALGQRRPDDDLYVPVQPGFIDLMEPIRQRQQDEICSRCISNKTVRLLSPTQPSRRNRK